MLLGRYEYFEEFGGNICERGNELVSKISRAMDSLTARGASDCYLDH